MKKLLLTIATLTISATTFAGWEVNKSIDIMTDAKTIILSTKSKNTTFGGYSKDTLVVRLKCSTKKMEALVLSPWIVGSWKQKYHVPVLVRFNKTKAFKMNMDKMKSRKGFFIPVKNTKAFIGTMKKANKLIMRYDQSGNKTVTPVFSLKGFSKALIKGKNACK